MLLVLFNFRGQPHNKALTMSWKFVFILYVASLSSANAFTLPNSACMKTTFNTCLTEFHQIALITAEDNRMTVAEYAKENHIDPTEVGAAYEATGLLTCDKYAVTANIVGDSHVLVTAGHAFFNEDCSERKVSQCFFSLKFGDTKKYLVDSTSLISGLCRKDVPNSSPVKPNTDLHEDWASIRLKESAPVKPYSFPAADLKITPNTPVRMVSAMQGNFRVKRVKTVQECMIRDMERNIFVSLETDCNEGPFASGAAQFALDSDPLGRNLIAINLGDQVNLKEGSGYNPDFLYAKSIAISGEFREAIERNIHR